MRKRFLYTALFISLALCSLLSCTSEKAQPASEILYLQNEDTYSLNLSSGEIRRIASGLIPESWSPSGFRVLLKSENQIHIYNENTSSEESSFPLQGLACPQLEEAAWLNDTTVLMRASAGAQSCLYAYSVMEEQIFHEELDFEGFNLLPSPDGSVWIQRTLEGLVLRNLGGEQTALEGLHLTYQPGLRYDLAFSPDGKQLAFVSDGELWKADIDIYGLHQPKQLNQPQSFMPDLRWSTNGKMLAFLAYDQQLSQTLLQILDADTGALLFQWKWPGRNSQLLWGPDSQQILSYSDTPFLLDISTGETSYPFGQETGAVYLLYDWKE